MCMSSIHDSQKWHNNPIKIRDNFEEDYWCFCPLPILLQTTIIQVYLEMHNTKNTPIEGLPHGNQNTVSMRWSNGHLFSWIRSSVYLQGVTLKHCRMYTTLILHLALKKTSVNNIYWSMMYFVCELQSCFCEKRFVLSHH